jgi:hypothetical protein
MTNSSGLGRSREETLVNESSVLLDTVEVSESRHAAHFVGKGRRNDVIENE